MPQQLFLQNIIACIWDFDKTLIPGYMQTPIFDHYRVDAKKFWKEVNELPNYYRKNSLDLIVPDTVYLNHFITYARDGIFKGLNNRGLREFGAEIEFYKGLPEFFDEVKHYVKANHADIMLPVRGIGFDKMLDLIEEFRQAFVESNFSTKLP